MADMDFIKKVQKVTWEGLDYFSQELHKMRLAFVPSQGNFIFFDTGQRDAGECLPAVAEKRHHYAAAEKLWICNPAAVERGFDG